LARWDNRPRRGFRSGTCPICEQHSDKLVYDHDHVTGKFRGWICHNCNLVLGKVKDNSIILRRMILYLEACRETDYEQEEQKEHP
jgi:hypothetical protein